MDSIFPSGTVGQGLECAFCNHAYDNPKKQPTYCVFVRASGHMQLTVGTDIDSRAGIEAVLQDRKMLFKVYLLVVRTEGNVIHTKSSSNLFPHSLVTPSKFCNSWCHGILQVFTGAVGACIAKTEVSSVWTSEFQNVWRRV